MSNEPISEMASVLGFLETIKTTLGETKKQHEETQELLGDIWRLLDERLPRIERERDLN